MNINYGRYDLKGISKFTNRLYEKQIEVCKYFCYRWEITYVKSYIDI